MDIKVKYIDFGLEDMGGLRQIDKGNWIDVRACKIFVNGEEREWGKFNKIFYNPGDTVKVYLGFAMELPKGYEALVSPRGSTFNKHGLIQVNSPGVIDSTFCGDNDQWFVPFYAIQKGCICKYGRIAQFRILESMGNLNIHEVEFLGNEDRGSYGSTGSMEYNI